MDHKIDFNRLIIAIIEIIKKNKPYPVSFFSNVAEINDRLKLFPTSGTMTHGEYALYGFLRS